MRQLLAKFLAGAALAVAVGIAPLASAQTALALKNTFTGTVGYVGTQGTRQTVDNSVDYCSAMSLSGTTYASLSGIPNGATILSARLYWTGTARTSGEWDKTVTFEGSSVTAAASDTTYVAIGNPNVLDYYTGAADVTALVNAKRNGSYSFANLGIVGHHNCDKSGAGLGWALLVIFSDVSQPQRVLKLYEGFQNAGSAITVGGFTVPNPVGTNGRAAYLAWGGTASQSGSSEGLRLKDVVLSEDSINPVSNQYNGYSSINSGSNSYGVDFDTFTVTSAHVNAGATSVDAEFLTSSPDAVYLGALVVAMPNQAATVDLQMAIARTGSLVLGQPVSYTLTVSNIGSITEPGAITVTSTLPSGLAYVGASGSNWLCGAVGQNVTCTHAGLLAAGASASPITLTATVTNNTGTVTTSAHVAGTATDSASGNNDASNTGTIVVPTYAFTDTVCVAGEPFGTAGQNCSVKAWTGATAGTAITPIYVTLLNGSGVPTMLDSANETTLSMQFALSCHNPIAPAGVRATFPDDASVLPLCKQSGATPTEWTTKALTFAAGSPSSNSASTFLYKDVGEIELFARQTSDTSGWSTGSSLPFVSKPATMTLSAIKYTNGETSVDNPEAIDVDDLVFAPAGRTFSMTVGAYASTGEATPNFGKETVPKEVTFDLAMGLGADKGMTMPPTLTGTFPSFVGGMATGSTFVVDEVGIINLTPKVVDYLGAGTVSGTPVKVGRFIPDHFDTVTTAPIPCAPALSCADGTGMAYSGQSFVVKVRAFKFGGTVELKNYAGKLAKVVTLTAYSELGGTSANPPFVASASTGSMLTVSGKPTATIDYAAFVLGAADADPIYTFPTAYANTDARNTAHWVAPTPIFIRAVDTDNVSSKREVSVEGEMRIVSGRLFVPNAYGSELLTMPLAMRAQYWDGAYWKNSTKDGVSTVSPVSGSNGILFSNCKKNLAAGADCKGAPVLEPTSTSSLTMAGGTAVVRLKAPGSTNNGSADVTMGTAASPVWLPSTVGRVVFGVYKSPVIYSREMY